jgi:hypothetical protein
LRYLQKEAGPAGSLRELRPPGAPRSKNRLEIGELFTALGPVPGERQRHSDRHDAPFRRSPGELDGRVSELARAFDATPHVGLDELVS